MPTGLCFSPNETKLYIADSGQPHHIRVFDVQKDNTLANGKVFCVIDNGLPDGIRCDGDGHIWSSAGDGVQIFSPDGSLIGKILVPESPANLCFGGKDFKTLFITARTSLYAINVGVKGRALAASEKSIDSQRFAKEILAFEAADKTNPPPKDAILFIGSSSIRIWKSVGQDFPEHKVINRGFGGSQLSDSVHYFDRIVAPYKPKMIVLFAGSNDIAAGKTPEMVFDDFKQFVEKTRATLPKTRLAYVSVSTSPSRWSQFDRVKAANKLISDYIAKDGKLIYIDVLPVMLGADGKPKAEIYGKDNLHMNPKGYELWTSVIRPYLK
jgi:lysophospholipase L1-like esterase